MTVTPSIKKRCDSCYQTVRHGRLQNRCKKNRRHNQRQG